MLRPVRRTSGPCVDISYLFLERSVSVTYHPEAGSQGEKANDHLSILQLNVFMRSWSPIVALGPGSVRESVQPAEKEHIFVNRGN